VLGTRHDDGWTEQQIGGARGGAPRQVAQPEIPVRLPAYIDAHPRTSDERARSQTIPQSLSFQASPRFA
jgi:hypothetical protein